jgi:hypothetical protein
LPSKFAKLFEKNIFFPLLLLYHSDIWEFAITFFGKYLFHGNKLINKKIKKNIKKFINENLDLQSKVFKYIFRIINTNKFI